MQYNVDYFIQKLSKIDESLWTNGQFQSSGNKKCANGHCGEFSNGRFFETEETQGLKKTFSQLTITDLCSNELIEDSWNCSRIAAIINDGRCNEYRQITPKQRILAALYDIKKLQEPPVVTVTKEVIKYVAVAETITNMEVVNN